MKATEKEIREFEVLDGPHEGIRLDIPKGVIAPPHIVLMVECEQTGRWLPEGYDLVVQPKTEDSNEMVPCYQLREYKG